MNYDYLIYYCHQGVIDGDLCEQYNSMDIAKKKSVAEDLDRTPSEVSLLLGKCSQSMDFGNNNLCTAGFQEAGGSTHEIRFLTFLNVSLSLANNAE